MPSLYKWLQFVLESVEFLMVALVLSNIGYAISYVNSRQSWLQLEVLATMRDLGAIWMTILLAIYLANNRSIWMGIWRSGWRLVNGTKSFIAERKDKRRPAQIKKQRVIAQESAKDKPSMFGAVSYLLMSWLRFVLVGLAGYFTIVTAQKVDLILTSKTFDSGSSTVFGLQSLLTSMYMVVTYCIITLVLLIIQQNASFYHIGTIAAASE